MVLPEAQGLLSESPRFPGFWEGWGGGGVEGGTEQAPNRGVPIRSSGQPFL